MVNTPEIRIECSDLDKFALVEGTKKQLQNHGLVKSIVDIDGVRAKFEDGWGLVRASNTQASLVTRYEATDPYKTIRDTIPC